MLIDGVEDKKNIGQKAFRGRARPRSRSRPTWSATIVPGTVRNGIAMRRRRGRSEDSTGGSRSAASGVALLLAIGSVSADAPRIVGRSDEAFDQSYALLNQALAPEDRLRLRLAVMVQLGPLGCLTTEPIPGDPLMTLVLGGQAVIRTCRHELNGMTFEDIIAHAYPDDGFEQP